MSHITRHPVLIYNYRVECYNLNIVASASIACALRELYGNPQSIFSGNNITSSMNYFCGGESIAYGRQKVYKVASPKWQGCNNIC